MDGLRSKCRLAPSFPPTSIRVPLALGAVTVAVLAGVLSGPAGARAANRPTPVPGSAPPAGPGPADASSRGAAAQAGTVALTFDDGPSAGYTPQVLDVLAAHSVRATFCLVGTQAQRFPELVRRIVAEGHALCNHSTRHDNLSQRTAEEIRADLTATNDIIRAAVPGAPVPYFRAPYGAWGGSAAVAAELGMARLGWTVDPRDWSRPGAEAIVTAVREQLRPGGIVLMHDAGGDRSQTVQALAALLPSLLEEGWTFTFPPGPATRPAAGPGDRVIS
jgi:peptidoglycan/xylan/chitin deacetylase (PgdA/CDA1 family)